MSDNGTELRVQNEIIISLLARLVWPGESLAKVVAEGKKNPSGYLKAYNALDGSKSGTQIAAIAGVTQQSMSEALQTWEELGIVIKLDNGRYKRMMFVQTKIKEKEKRN